jgi:hypothetical protein
MLPLVSACLLARQVVLELVAVEAVEEMQGKEGKRVRIWGFRGLGLEVVGLEGLDREGQCLRWRTWGWRSRNMGLVLRGGNSIGKSVWVLRGFLKMLL